MIKKLLQEGFTLKAKGHYKRAIEIFYKALGQDNTSNELLLEIAELYYLLAHEERALSYIEQILEKVPTHVEALKLLKRIFISKGALSEAEQTAKNIYCISHKSNDLIEIFRLLNLQNKYDEIFEYKYAEPSFDIYFEQAKALFSLGNYEKAEDVLNKAIDLKPKSQEALLLMGQILYAQNKKDDCVKLLDCLVKDENNPELLNFIGLLQLYRHDYMNAVRTFLDVIKLNRSNSQYYFNLANAYFKLEEYSLAKKYYNMAISLSPENPNYHLALAKLYYSQRHYKKALEELGDDLFDARLLKAIILYDTGYLALSKQQLILLFAQCPENVIVNDYLQKINEELGLS